jgi:hypothetical protein
MNEDVTLRVLDYAMRVAVLDIGRQFAPVVNAFVLVVAFSQDWIFGPGLIGGTHNERRCRCSGKKTSSRCIGHDGITPLT